MTCRGPIPWSLVFVLLFPVVLVLGFAFSLARNAPPSVREEPVRMAHSYR
jgi:hypothetical protein